MSLYDFGKIRLFSSPFMPDRKISLLKDGKPVWAGDIDAPFDDVDFNEAVVSTGDYERISEAINAHPAAKGDA